MSQPIRPGSYSSSPRYTQARGPSFFSIVRERGVYGMVVAVTAMALGLSPTVFLAWWNLMRLSPVPIAGTAVRVQVRDGELTQEADDDKPGETALLHVACDVGSPDRWHELLQFEDQMRYKSHDPMPAIVRKEQVYIRSTKRAKLPFGLLGQPPVSAWLPAGKYEILVVYEASCGFENTDVNKPSIYPLAKELIAQELVAGQRTDVRVQLSHHQNCTEYSLTMRNDDASAKATEHAAEDASRRALSPAELEPLLTAIEKNIAIPTPGGVILDLPEPVIHHHDSHRMCEVDFRDTEHQPREWTRSQLWALIDWLPRDAVTARERLHDLERSLAWREYFQGWFWYVTTGASGIAFARWATIAKLKPFASRNGFAEAIKLFFAIFILALIAGGVASAIVNLRR